MPAYAGMTRQEHGFRIRHGDGFAANIAKKKIVENRLITSACSASWREYLPGFALAPGGATSVFAVQVHENLAKMRTLDFPEADRTQR